MQKETTTVWSLRVLPLRSELKSRLQHKSIPKILPFLQHVQAACISIDISKQTCCLKRTRWDLIRAMPVFPSEILPCVGWLVCHNAFTANHRCWDSVISSSDSWIFISSIKRVISSKVQLFLNTVHLFPKVVTNSSQHLNLGTLLFIKIWKLTFSMHRSRLEQKSWESLTFLSLSSSVLFRHRRLSYWRLMAKISKTILFAVGQLECSCLHSAIIRSARLLVESLR